MLVVCRRYANSNEDAEDILQEGFITVFTKLHQFRMEGSFEGWIRRIIVSRAIEHCRKKSNIFSMADIDEYYEEAISPNDIIGNMEADELMQMISELPGNLKMVFNLYIFEDMGHKEIAETLGIAEGTSKSSLFHARVFLRKKMKQSMTEPKQNKFYGKRL